ncbi:MAG TPA: FAD:protein FMN transferase [Ktedonobacteraceae bacterium]|nr:FAD:protein FMN transferase [Ktedonobacteraceae bacterium]
MAAVVHRHNQSQELTHPEHFALPAGMARSQFRAMGTTVEVLLPTSDLKRGEKLVKALFADWEQRLSRFLPESELSRLNRMAGTPIIASRLLYTVLDRALAAAEMTDGMYDPTLLYQLMQAGYDRTFDEVQAKQPDGGYTPRGGGRWREIERIPALRMVTLPEGIGVDFGGIAKGMAVDAALEQLRIEGIQPALVNAGGDLAVLGVPAQEGQWPIEVQGKNCSWVIPFARGALATSGIDRRRWMQGSQARHHLLDPRTGLPAQNGLWSVTVATDRCEQAEVAAKVAFLLGKEKGSEFLQKHNIAGLLVQEDGTWTAVGSWPTDRMIHVKKEV